MSKEKPVAGIPRIKLGNHTFYYQYEPSLLDALETQEIQAPYSCRAGYCGSCKVRLLEGEVSYTDEGMVDLQADEILTCICIPATHIEIELPDD
ncbi:MAG: 2Fe-2S iron-sulfur cluster binding domain-containing protein [Oceanospirillaceae bacterium]|nr:2Fe-2S iron-sulfur cluster binding domain-containing protein [Oceanospirillaceae bacterium]